MEYNWSGVRVWLEHWLWLKRWMIDEIFCATTFPLICELQFSKYEKLVDIRIFAWHFIFIHLRLAQNYRVINIRSRYLRRHTHSCTPLKRWREKIYSFNYSNINLKHFAEATKSSLLFCQSHVLYLKNFRAAKLTSIESYSTAHINSFVRCSKSYNCVRLYWLSRQIVIPFVHQVLYSFTNGNRWKLLFNRKKHIVKNGFF